MKKIIVFLILIAGLGVWLWQSEKSATEIFYGSARPVSQNPVKLKGNPLPLINSNSLKAFVGATHWISNGITELQDPSLTPGDVNSALTVDVLCSKGFTTKSVRDQTTTASQKATTYQSYNVPHPAGNSGKGQKCELDHLISLEIGGADTLKNIWPQCVDGYNGWQGLGFHDKDKIENRLHADVCAGKVTLQYAQKCISTDWTKCYAK